MRVRLRPITREECQIVRTWRNRPDVLPMLRTGYKTAEEQDRFYDTVIADETHSCHAYWAIETVPRFLGSPTFVGMGGLTYLRREPRQAEISLIINPSVRGRGIGRKAVDALLAEAKVMDLESVIGECYEQNPAKAFWERMLELYPPVRLEQRAESFVWRWRLS